MSRRELEGGAEIAAAPARQAEPSELADPLVGALEAERAFEASANALERADRMLGALLDALT